MAKVEFQHPKPGAKIKVIGAGLPRTSTVSFSAALGILLDGPYYHAGVQYANGTTDESHIRTMIEVAKYFPYDSQSRKDGMLGRLSKQLDGYITTNDPPLTLLVPELMELYPDAKVICTVRDRSAWAKSMMNVVRASQPKLAGFIFFWVPSVRYLPSLVPALTHIFYERYGIEIVDEATALQVWDRHYRLLEESVPKEKLFYFDVKDGWEPLCKALNVPVPDVPFPRLNDAKDMEAHFKMLAVQGLTRWAVAVGCFSIVSGLAYWMLLNR